MQDKFFIKSLTMFRPALSILVLVFLCGSIKAQISTPTHKLFAASYSAPVSPIIIQDIKPLPMKLNGVIPGQTKRSIGMGMILVGGGLQGTAIALIIKGTEEQADGAKNPGYGGKNYSTGYLKVLGGLAAGLVGTGVALVGTSLYTKGTRQYNENLYYIRQKSLSLKIDSGITLSYRF
jgi:hypothetical protein